MLQLQNIILEMVAKGEALADTADRLCVEVENRCPGTICSILRVDRGYLHPLSAPSLPAGFTAAIEGLAIGPNVGSCGSAAFCGAAVVVTDIENDPRWTIASKLGIQILAEGVETEGQSGHLRRFGCTLGQGHLFSEALPRELVTTMLLRSARPGHDRAVTTLRRADHGSDSRGAVLRRRVLTSLGFAVLPSL